MLLDQDQPVWITVAGVENTDYFNRATWIAAEIIKESMSKSYKFKAVDKYLHTINITYRVSDYRISFSMDGQLQGVVWVTSHILWNQ